MTSTFVGRSPTNRATSSPPASRRRCRLPRSSQMTASSSSSPRFAARDGTVLRRVDDRYAAAVYPFVDGRSFPYGAFLSIDHFDAVLGQVVRIHDIADPAASGAATDDLVVPHRDDLSAALDQLGQRWETGPFAEAARRCSTAAPAMSSSASSVTTWWRDAVAEHPERMVLTHGEPHPRQHARDGSGLAARRLGHDLDRRSGTRPVADDLSRPVSRRCVRGADWPPAYSRGLRLLPPAVGPWRDLQLRRRLPRASRRHRGHARIARSTSPATSIRSDSGWRHRERRGRRRTP